MFYKVSWCLTEPKLRNRAGLFRSGWGQGWKKPLRVSVYLLSIFLVCKHLSASAWGKKALWNFFFLPVFSIFCLLTLNSLDHYCHFETLFCLGSWLFCLPFVCPAWFLSRFPLLSALHALSCLAFLSLESRILYILGLSGDHGCSHLLSLLNPVYWWWWLPNL